MESFTADIFTPYYQGKQSISRTILYKDKIVLASRKEMPHSGLRDGNTPNATNVSGQNSIFYEMVYYPIFNLLLLEKDGKKQEVFEYNKHLAGNWTTDDLDKYLGYLLHLGDNGNGYLVVNPREEKIRKMIANQACDLLEGAFGFQFDTMVPVLSKEVWMILKSYAEFRDIETECYDIIDDPTHIDVNEINCKHWYFSAEIAKILTAVGMKVYFEKTLVKDPDELYKAVKEFRNQSDDSQYRTYLKLSKRFEKLKKERLRIDEAQNVEKLPRIYFEALHWQGLDVYGGGKWLAKDEHNLYLIVNHGRPNDNWRLNTIRTEWIGAKAHKTPLTSQTKDLLTEIEAYEYEVKTNK